MKLEQKQRDILARIESNEGLDLLALYQEFGRKGTKDILDTFIDREWLVLQGRTYRITESGSDLLNHRENRPLAKSIDGDSDIVSNMALKLYELEVRVKKLEEMLKSFDQLTGKFI